MTVYAECRAHHSAGSVDAVGWAKARSRRAHHFHERKDGGARLRFAHPDYRLALLSDLILRSRVAASRRMNGTSRASWFETALRASSPWGF